MYIALKPPFMVDINQELKIYSNFFLKTFGLCYKKLYLCIRFRELNSQALKERVL